MTRACVFLDVFTDRPFAGNQLAVFPSAEGLSNEQMQKLANEINYSETTFIFGCDRDDADFEVRIFTIRFELPFAGHPILGTAYSIWNLLDVWPEKSDMLRLKTKVGVVSLEKQGDLIWMTQPKPTFLNRYTDKKEIAGMLGLSPDDIADDLPVEEVSTGIPMLIVPLKDRTVIQRAMGNLNLLLDFFKDKESLAPYLFTLDTEGGETKVHTRFFAPHIGIIEDAATGAAAGPLTAYLLKNEVFGKRFEIQNEQGVEMGRPSVIRLSGERNEDGTYSIRVGGACAYIGKGEFIV